MVFNAYAKINLTLDITGKRPDGYHIIDSVMQTVSLYDTVSVEKSDNITVDCDNDGIIGDGNITCTAAKAFFEHTGIRGGAYINIKKRIPLAAGLGGGSADAAAVILGLNRLYGTQLSTASLCKIGLSVGADVPFCVVGGTARVGGIGEVVTRLPSLADCGIVIVKHGHKLSTKDMYSKIDAADYSGRTTPQAVAAIYSGNLEALCKNVGNVFSSLALNRELERDFQKTSPLCVSLSGSGPSMFALYHDAATADIAADMLTSLGYNALCTRPISGE